MQLPVEYKLRNLEDVVRINENEPGLKREMFFEKVRDGKIILRGALKKHVPDGIVNQEKQGFSAPDASWYRGESIDYVKRMVLDKKARIFDHLDYGTVKGLVSEHLEGKRNRRLFIWSLLNFELWLRAFVS
jgi:asparagine synthase (glutamine-hydrolysing)